MTIVTIFFIVLITAFAVVMFFTEPSKADKTDPFKAGLP